ncbi:hypothetical protein EV702DRAFT_1045318 [Suillus placidus]|uniref:Uncharacterized protein n=1 Tax=Suillus placidus TaxID=48579 RepID=A0A9P6ZVK6_9AGAM|nr:hypothetical protein EV702DRAFT_1045318 [Suillus placidus]
MQDLARRMEGIEKDVSTIKHQNVDEDLATDGHVDAEQEKQPCPRWKHANKKKSKEPVPLSSGTYQMSELDTDDKDEKKARKTDVQRAANLSEHEVHAGVPVWETIRPAWRSEEVCLKDFEELDSIREEQPKESRRKMALTRRVNLGNNNNNAPPSIPIFPFMLDSEWHDSYQARGPHAPIAMYEQDPQGFKKPEGQHDKDLTKGNSERANKNGGTACETTRSGGIN